MQVPFLGCPDNSHLSGWRDIALYLAQQARSNPTGIPFFDDGLAHGWVDWCEECQHACLTPEPSASNGTPAQTSQQSLANVLKQLEAALNQRGPIQEGGHVVADGAVAGALAVPYLQVQSHLLQAAALQLITPCQN